MKAIRGLSVGPVFKQLWVRRLMDSKNRISQHAVRRHAVIAARVVGSRLIRHLKAFRHDDHRDDGPISKLESWPDQMPTPSILPPIPENTSEATHSLPSEFSRLPPKEVSSGGTVDVTA